MRIFITLILWLIVTSIIQAQTTINYDLNNTNIHFSPTPTGGGFSPQSNYTIITKPLVAEPYAINPQAGVNAATIYSPAGNVNNVFFGGDLLTISGTGSSAIPIFTKQIFSQSDFPIYLECNFYSRSSSPLYNESYLFIVPSNYQYFASPTTYTPQQTTQREGILFGGHPNNLRIVDHKSTTQASVFTNYPHSFTTYGNWYNQKMILDYVNGNLIVRSATIDNNNVMTNVNLGAYTWLNSIRLGIAVDDMAEGFEIISDYSDLIVDFEVSDTTICAGECVDLTDLSTTSFCTNCNAFQWLVPDAATTTSTQQNPNNICFQNSGTFPITLIVSNSVESDTITKMITVLPSPNVDLGNDTILCNNQTVTLDATIPNAVSYLWSNNSTNSTLTVTTIGNYSVEVFDGNCSDYDTIFINVTGDFPIVNLGNDTTLCQGDTLLLDAFSPIANSYLWNDSSTNTTLAVTTGGQFIAEATNNCGTTSDTIDIQLLISELEINLGNDTTLCDGDLLTLNVFEPTVISYLWQDNSTNPTYEVTQSGTYQVTVSDVCETVTDSIFIEYITLEVNLGNDTAICEGRSFMLDVSHTNAENYVWHDGSTNSYFGVQSEGLIYVTLENHCEIVSDTMQVTVSTATPLVPNLGENQTLCPGQTIVLDATTENALNYIWQDSTENVLYFVTEPGIYKVTVSNACLSISDEIEFMAGACCNLFVPNVFTPNNDGNNDTFHAYTNCEVTGFSMMIFDRWGGKLFETRDINQGWDGMKDGQLLNNGVYVYMISFYDGFSNRNKEGSVTLIR